MDYQKVIIIGNLGKDPEMRYTPTGTPVTQFSVAVNRQYSNGQGELVKETTWFNVSAWGKRGEACKQYLRKGSKVMVEGRMVPDRQTGGPRIWSRQDGSVGASFELIALDIRFLSARQENNVPEHNSEDPVYDNIPPEDDIPF